MLLLIDFSLEINIVWFMMFIHNFTPLNALLFLYPFVVLKFIKMRKLMHIFYDLFHGLD